MMSCPYDSTAVATKNKSDVTSTSSDAKELPIPQPPVHWFTGNLPELDPSFPSASIWRLADLYGPIYKLDFVTRQAVVISSHELINQACDEDHFDKSVNGGLKEARALAGDGLFTAFPEEPNWWKAHRILMPVFGPLPIKKMFPDMLDIVSQLVLRWDRLGPRHEIEPSDDFTISFSFSTLAFDTIGLCAFSYRYNSFYSPKPVEFQVQMGEVLTECGRRASRLAIETKMRIFAAEHTKENIEAMWKLCDELVAERRAHPQPDSRDLMNTMMTVADPVTGEMLSDENIRFNMVTFLIAGHETTSGTLAMMMYHLLKNPEKYHKAQAEVDEVVGDNVLELKHLSQLKYLEACIRETLRCQGPINAISLTPKEDILLGGKYRVAKGTFITCNLKGLHHDPKVWGEDADLFRPERLLNGGWEALPQNAFKPFGNGRRACIGRAFAEQEMLMVTALILQRFQAEMVDPSYNLTLKSTLTVKPKDFKIKVRRRAGKSWTVGIPGSMPSTTTESSATSKITGGQPSGGKSSLLILYGSNAGTCKSLAEDLETVAEPRFQVTVQTMDHATEHLPKQGAVVIISPSYEGRPADNAKKFVSWLEASSDPELLKGVKFGVFGVGNSEWHQTYHRIPKLIDEMLPQLGAERVLPAGFVDVKDDLVGPYEDWKEKLIVALSGEKADALKTEELVVEIGKPDAAVKLGGDEMSHGFVKKNDVIADTSVGPEKRHMEVELPEGTTYRTGDYLVVLPTNPPDVIERVMSYFKLSPDDVINISGTNKSFLGGSGPITALELIGARVELSTPISQRQLQTIASNTTDASTRAKLESLATTYSSFKAQILETRTSILDILTDNPSATLTLAQYLDFLLPLSPRQFSISSSPLSSPDPGPITATLTYDVHTAPARSSPSTRTFHGVASTYLATRSVGSKLRCHVRATNAAFHLPTSLSIPIIMICAGTGIAPMRGFIAERAAIRAANPDLPLSRALLYFGCRDYEKDFIYREELNAWKAAGVVEIRMAFSQRAPDASYRKYVHERMWEEREELAGLFREGAKIFVCGSASKLGQSSSDTVLKIYKERNPEKSEEEAFEWLQAQREDRYVTDVFE